MTPNTLARGLLISALLSVAACSSSDSGNSDGQDAEGADNSAEQALPATPGTSDNSLINDPTQTPDTTGDENGNSADESDPGGETVSGDGTDNGENSNPDDNTNSEEEPDPEDNTTDVESTEVLIPPTTPGSDLDRLVQGLARQASATLLDLNRRISQGEDLTEQQETCIGPFEEGFGEPLLAVNCDPKLATGEVALWVGQAAFYNTRACREALFNQGSEACVLERMSLLIGADWKIPESGGRPTLEFPGAELAYAIDGTMLSINNTEERLGNLFSCDISLETLAISSSLNVTNCEKTVKSMVDEIERLQGLELSF